MDQGFCTLALRTFGDDHSLGQSCPGHWRTSSSAFCPPEVRRGPWVGYDNHKCLDIAKCHPTENHRLGHITYCQCFGFFVCKCRY